MNDDLWKSNLPQGILDPRANVISNNKLRSSDKSWIEKTTKVAKERSKTEKWKKSIENRQIDYKSMDKTSTKEAQKVKCSTPWGTFDSMQEAAKAGNIHEETLRRRIIANNSGYSKEDKHKGKKFSKPIQTPFGKFNSQIEAAKYATENNIMLNALKKIQKYLKTDTENYFYITE